MTSINSSVRSESHLSVSTVFAESVFNSGPVISPIRIRFDETYGFGDESDDEKKKGQGKASTIKTSIFRGLQQFPFHNKMKKIGSAPASPTTPETIPKSNNQNTRTTVNARFRLFKSTPKSTKDSRRPPPLNLESLPKASSSRPIIETKKAFLASPIKLDDSTLTPKDYDFAKSPEAGVQLLSQTLSQESDQEGVRRSKRKGLFRFPENSSPWFTSQGPSPIETTGDVAIKFSGSCLPALSNKAMPQYRGFSSSLQKNQQPIVKSTPAVASSLLMPGSPVVQPPTPSSTGSPKSFLFDEDEETDIEDSPADFYATKLSHSISRRSSLSVSRNSSRRSSISRSRKSSTASFFCCGQRLSFDRCNSIGLGGLTGDEVEITDDAGSTFYPGISELKSKSSWLCTNSPEYSSSDDEDDDEDSEIEEAYQKHLSLITQIRNKSTSSLVVSTPELTMSSSVSSVSSYGQILGTPPSRRNRRRTASSECIVLEALEEMRAVGLGNSEGVEKKSRGLGLLGDMDFGSEWADVLWEMNSDEQVGWDWETQQITLIGV